MRRVLLFVGLVAVVVAGVLGVSGAGGASGSVPGRWVITDLGTLGGKQSTAAAINERGQVVGGSDTRAGTKGGNTIGHAFLWQSGKMRDLGSLAGSSWASDINDRGQVVGTSVGRTKNPQGNRIEHAVLWQGGKMFDLTPTAKLAPLDCYGDGFGGSCAASGDAINGRGQVVVSMTSNQSGNLHIDRAFLWQSGKLVSLPTLGASRWGSTWAEEINDRGQVVGAAETGIDLDGPLVHAFVWQNGKMTDLGTLSGKLESNASSINEHGEIAGWSGNSFHEGIGAHCVLWQKGKASDLGIAGGDCFAGPINDSGQIVGWHKTRPDDSAFLWQGGKLTDLGTIGGEYEVMINARGTVVYTRTDRSSHNAALVWQNGRLTKLPDLGGGVSSANAINNHNQIVGYSTTKTGRRHAVLWTLKPGS